MGSYPSSFTIFWQFCDKIKYDDVTSWSKLNWIYIMNYYHREGLLMLTMVFIYQRVLWQRINIWLISGLAIVVQMSQSVQSNPFLKYGGFARSGANQKCDSP